MPFQYHHPWDLDAQRDFDLRPLPVSGSPYAEPACPLNCLFARTAPLIPTPAHSVHTTYSNLPGDATTDLVSRAAQCLREKGKTSIQFESDPSLVSQLVDRLLHQINLPICKNDDNRPFMAEWLLNDMFAQRISADEELLNEGNLAHYFLFTYCARANLFARKSVLWKGPDLCRGKWRLAPQDVRDPSGIAAYVTRGERLQPRAVLEIKRRREVPNWVLETLAWLAEQPGGCQLILEEDKSSVPELRLSIPSEEGLADRVMRAWEEDADGKVHTHPNEAVVTFKFTTVKILSQIYLQAVSNLAEYLLLFNDSDCMLFRCDDPRDPQRFSLSPDIPPLGISHRRLQPTFTTLLVALLGITYDGAQKRPGDISRGEQRSTKRQRTESRDPGPSADHDFKENVDEITSRAPAFTFDDRILTPFPLSAPQPTHADEGGVTVGNSGRNFHILDSSADLAELPSDNVAFVPTHDMGRGAIGRTYGGLLYLPSSASSADAIAEAKLADGTHDNGHDSSKRSPAYPQPASSLPQSLPTLNAPRSSGETSAIEESNVAPASRLGTSTSNDTAILASTSSTNSDRSVACAPVRAVLKVTDLLTYLNGDEFALDLARLGLQLDDPRPPSRDEARQLVLNEANIYRSVFTGSRTAATIVPAYYGMWATGPAGCEVLVQVMDELGPAIGDSWQTLDWRWRPVIEHAYRQLHSLGVVHGDLEPRHIRLRSNDNGIPPDADASSLSPSTPDSKPSLAGLSSDLSDSPNDRLDGRHPSISPSRLVLIDFDHAKVASQEEIDAEWAELQTMCNYYLKHPRQ